MDLEGWYSALMKLLSSLLALGVVALAHRALAAPEYAFVDPGLGSPLVTVYQVNNRGDFTAFYNSFPNNVFLADNGPIFWRVSSSTASIRGLTASRLASVYDPTGPKSYRFDIVTGNVSNFAAGEVRLTNDDDEGIFWNGTQHVLAKFDGTILGTYDASLRLLAVPSTQNIGGRSIRQSINRDGALVAVKSGSSDTAHLFNGATSFALPWSAAPNTVGLTLTSAFLNDSYIAAGAGSKTVNFQNQRFGWVYAGGQIVEISRSGSIDVTGLDNAGNVFGADGFDNGSSFAATQAWRWNSSSGKVPIASLVAMPDDTYTRTLVLPNAVSPNGIVAVRFSGTSASAGSISGGAMLVPLSMTGRIEGRVESPDYGGTWDGFPALLSIYEGTKLVANRSIYLRADGSFTLNEPTLGTRDYRIRTRHFLQRKISGVTLSAGGSASLNFTLLGGDIDRDNAITVFDYIILSQYFERTSADANWNTVGANGHRPSSADLDFDGEVSIFDYIILSGNFDMQGD